MVGFHSPFCNIFDILSVPCTTPVIPGIAIIAFYPTLFPRAIHQLFCRVSAWGTLIIAMLRLYCFWRLWESRDWGHFWRPGSIARWTSPTGSHLLLTTGYFKVLSGVFNNWPSCDMALTSIALTSRSQVCLFSNECRYTMNSSHQQSFSRDLQALPGNDRHLSMKRKHHIRFRKVALSLPFDAR